ncbi:MAG: hypothetical protein M3040_06305 [Bacteroidota bacterium]|nr:hypothetical protein [Bacteroidota bacterium]
MTNLLHLHNETTNPNSSERVSCLKPTVCFKLLLVVLLTALTTNLFANTITTVGNGNWNSTTPNAPWPGGTLPASTDDVIIGNGLTLTVTANQICNSLSFTAPSSGSGSGTLIVNTGYVLTVTTAVSASAPTVAVKATGLYYISGGGQVNCATLNCNNNLLPTGGPLTNITLTSTLTNLNVSGDLNIYSTYNSSGGKSNNGKFNIQSGTVTVNGNINTISSNSANIVTLDLVTSANNPSLIIGGSTPFNLSATGTNTISLNGTGATVTYNGAAQAVYNTSYTNLSLAGSGIKSMPVSAINVTNNLSISGTANTVSGSAVTVGGDVSIGPGSTFTAGSYGHNVAGNWSNSGTFTAGTSTVNLNGSSQQTISGGATTTFNNLTLNNTTGASISTSPVITGILTFTNGKITTGTNKVTLGAAATTAGVGTGKYIYGNEEIFIPNATAPTRTFDIGDNSNYMPVVVAFSGTASGSGSITASMQPGDHADVVNSGINGLLSVNRNWTLTNAGVSGYTSYGATFNYIAADKDALANAANFVVRSYDGSNWNATNLVSANTLSTRADGMTSFGTYQIGTPGSAPVIVTNPVAVSACSSNGASFTATATATPTAIIKWQRDPNTGTFSDITATSDGSIYSSYNSTTLNISNTAGLSNYQYRAVFTNINGVATSTSSTLSVTTAPAATISYGSTVFCNTGSAAASITGTPTGTFSSTTGLNINPASGLINLASSAPGTYAVTYAIVAAGACPLYQNNLSLTINGLGTWTGAVSTDWNTAGNWQCGVIPTITTDVTIPASLFNYPVISSTATATANNLTLQSGSSITVSNGVLQIAGTPATAGGKITASSGKVEFKGSAAQVIPASLFAFNVVKDLAITNPTTVTLAGAVRVTNSVSFGNVNSSTLNSNGYLTLVSTAANTANVTDITNAGINSGNKILGDVTVERYVQGKRAYRFLTAPVNSTTSIKTNWMENTNNPSTSVNYNPVPGYGTHITGVGGNTNGFDVTGTNNPSLFSFNNTNQTWVQAPNTSGLFSAGNGFRTMVRGNRSVDLNNNSATPSTTTLRARGTLVTGPVVFAATGGTAGMPALSTVTGAYNFIANPYASSVNWESVVATANDVSPSLYIFDPTISGSNGRGGYVSYNAILKVTSILSSLIAKDVQSGQAFFVQTKGPNPSLTFKESYKSTGFLPVFRSSSEVPHIILELMLPDQVTTGSASDGAAVYFSDDYSPAISDEDSYKFTNQDENIAIMRNGIPLSLEGRKPVSGVDSVSLKIWQLTGSNYTLKINVENFESNVEGYFEDRFLKTTTPLQPGQNLLPFSITSNAASAASNRFNIVFETLATLPVRLTGVKAYVKNKGVQVDWVGESESNMDLYEVERSIDAQHFETIGSAKAKNNPGIASAYSFFDATPVAGDNYYRVKALEKSGDIKLSEVMKVQVADAKSAITVTNNPVQGGVVKLLFNNAEKGNYVVSVMNLLGEKVYTGNISYTGGTSYEEIKLNSHLPAGIYQLQVNNNSFNKNIQILVK